MYFIIYETTNKVNNKTYRGCHETENLSDGYLGSGTYLKRAIRKYGKENFDRKILEYCENRKHMSEREKYWINEEFILNENNYNLKTGGLNEGSLGKYSRQKISQTVKSLHKEGFYLDKTRKGIPVPKKTKEKISKKLVEIYSKKEHHLKGKDPWNKGLKGVQAVSDDTKKKISERSKEYWSIKENRKSVSEKLKDRYRNEEHHLKGKEPWNKGKNTGPSWNKGLSDVKIECPHCGKIGGRSNMKRWHFDNCKNQYGK